MLAQNMDISGSESLLSIEWHLLWSELSDKFRVFLQKPWIVKILDWHFEREWNALDYCKTWK